MARVPYGHRTAAGCGPTVTACCWETRQLLLRSSLLSQLRVRGREEMRSPSAVRRAPLSAACTYVYSALIFLKIQFEMHRSVANKVASKSTWRVWAAGRSVRYFRPKVVVGSSEIAMRLVL